MNTNTERIMPYDTCDIEKTAGEQIAEELRASGKYALVECRRRKPEGGRQYVRIYVQRKQATPKERLEYLRGELRAERLSWGDVLELQKWADYIEPGDVELLEAAGVPEGRN